MAKTYIVQEHDTWESIASASGVSAAILQKQNLVDPASPDVVPLEAGRTLVIPAAADPQVVHVSPGDTNTVVAPGATVVLVGSPEPDQKYRLQFVTAAATLPMGPHTQWLVERTGYEKSGGPMDFLQGYAVASAWVTPQRTAVQYVNAMPSRSISRLVVFSHGVSDSGVFPDSGNECMAALRYDWPNLSDYGLSVDDVPSIDPTKFRKDARIELHSCNSATVGVRRQSLAEALANRLNLVVWGWTGRTSYADINSGKGTRVRASEEGWGDKKQWFDDHVRGRTPVFKPIGPSCPAVE